MKKSILIFCICAVLSIFTACGNSGAEETVTETTTSVLALTETLPETTVAETTISQTTTSATTTEATTVSEVVTETTAETTETQAPITTTVTTTTAAETTVSNPKSTDHFLTGMEIEAPAEIPNGWMTETATETTAVTKEVTFDFVADPIVFTYDEDCDYEEKLDEDLIEALAIAGEDEKIAVYIYLEYSSDALYLDKARDDAVYRENYALGDVIQKAYLSYLMDYNKAFADEITGGDDDKIVIAKLTLILELTPDEIIKVAKCEQVTSMNRHIEVEMSND